MNAALLRDGEVLAPAELATSRKARRRGLLGRNGIDGVLVLRPCRQVHTVGMRFAVDVAWCRRDGHVLRTASLSRRRVSRPVLRSSFVLEAEAGTFDHWGLNPGDRIQVTP